MRRNIGPDRRAYRVGQVVRASIDTLASDSLPSEHEFLRQYSAFPRMSRTWSAFRRSDASGKRYGPPTAGFPLRSPSSAMTVERDQVLSSPGSCSRQPALSSGRYTVRGCWTPGRPESLVGRGKIWIGATECEASLLVSLGQAENRAEALREHFRLVRERWWSSAERSGPERGSCRGQSADRNSGEPCVGPGAPAAEGAVGGRGRESVLVLADRIPRGSGGGHLQRIADA